MNAVRNLVLVLGDQLDDDSAAFDGFDPALDRIALVEAPGEATHVWSHRARIALFLAAMRHFSSRLRARGWPVHHVALDEARLPGEPPDAPPLPDGLVERVERLVRLHRPQALVLVEPGEWRLEQALLALPQRLGEPLRVVVRDDRHFLCSRADFARWAAGRRGLRLEFFYREMRRRHRVLLQPDGEPEGGQWNFDADNRSAYPRTGPGTIPPPAAFAPDDITREVLALVERRFPDHPGRLDAFGWAVTREQALQALAHFVEHRLPVFGRYQDAMWTRTPFGWHALLSTSLNLKLLHPGEVVEAAQAAWRSGRVALADAEGFIRQVLGWREFIRGVYWLDMPGLARANHFGHARELPRWYWDGDTRMACMRDVVGQVLEHGYAHHIQRLMVTGQFALLAEVDPRQVADWYLAAYVDAVEWVELPNVAGMALFADGGRFTSKPYVASGAYVDRQSNYCRGCAYDPKRRSGDGACPMTALFWHFLDRHEAALAANPRTALMAKNVARLSSDERTAIRDTARRMLEDLDAL